MRLTVTKIQDMKRNGERIAMLTAYDYPTAGVLDEAGAHMLLVGDSMGIVVYGYDTTLKVTLDDIARHTGAVVRGSKQSLVVADMPFLTYQVNIDDAVRNAGRLLQDAGAQAVKLEGGLPMEPTIRRMVDCGIPVMAHIGLTPQSVNQLGGYRVQGRTPEVASKLVSDALAVQAAGAFAVVLECVPTHLAAYITRTLEIPTIGIGAGVGCDGQVQVIHDLLGLFNDFVPRHARRYAELRDVIKDAVARYIADVSAGAFPTDQQSFSMDESIIDGLRAESPSRSPS
ncbi:MAG: 3-methyl-2-oxobutanoate hydroxymethyltransferase [Chloroflexota bacterium]